MKAFVVEHYGKDGLRAADVPEPEVGDGDVLVKVSAAGINPLDMMVRSGEFKRLLKYRTPFVLGHDGAGVVTRVGSGVRDLQVGDEVYARTRDLRIGTFAEYIAIDQDDVAPKPVSPTLHEAAAVPQDFVFADNPNVPQATIAALAEGAWIDDRESIIFVGDSGTGKTMLATGLAVCACHQGRRVRFTTLAGLANELQEAESRRELARVVGRYARTELVVLDLGYLALPDGATELVFQVLSERHERGSLIVTTNLPFGEWTKVFPDPRLAKAVVDRLTHRAHIIDTGTESWRFRHGLTRKRTPAR